MGLNTPDNLSREILEGRPSGGRRVLVACRGAEAALLEPFFTTNKKQLRDVRDASELRHECARLRAQRGRSPLQRFSTAVSDLFSDIALALGPFTLNLTVANHRCRYIYNDDSSETIIRIHEDNIDASTFGQYFDLYEGVAAEHFPVFVIIASSSLDSLSRRLRMCPPQLEFVSIGEHMITRRFALTRSGCDDLSMFVSQYTSEAFSSVAATPTALIASDQSSEFDHVQRLAMHLLKIKAGAEMLGKFEMLNEANELDSQLHELQSSLSLDPQGPKLLCIKALSNLWLLYCGERQRGLLENSMAIACALEEPLLQAHCLRYIGLLERHSAFTEYCLRRANAIFMERESFDVACYCVNNYLVGYFYKDEPCDRLFDELLDESRVYLRGIRALRIVFNNTGVAHLISGDADRALALFGDGMREAGHEVHRLGLLVNQMIARRILGDKIENDEVLATLERTVENLDPRYRYQRANILANLAVLADKSADTRNLLGKLLESGGFLDDRQIMSSEHGLGAAFMRAGIVNGVAPELPGLRGRFIKRHGLVPIIHHAWL